MSNNRKTAKKFIVVWLLAVICCLCCPLPDIAAAKERFIIDAQMLPSTKQTYDILVTIENQGEDWEGAARLMLDNVYRESGKCAYDTVLSLPQGSTKQFTIRMPKATIESTEGTIHISLMEKENKIIASKEFPRLLQNIVEGIKMGILSDNYAALTYLDMGGRELYYHNRSLPIRLLQLNQDNLKMRLPELELLVIDNFHTEVLDNETVDALAHWVDDGGVLIVGTGSYAKDTLGGLGFLGVECRKINAPAGIEQDNVISSYDYVMNQLPLAELRDKNSFYEIDADNIALAASQNSGSVGILSYSLIEFGKLGVENLGGVTQEGYVKNYLLSIICSYADSSDGSDAYDFLNTYAVSSTFNRLLRILGNSSRLDFSVLQWLIALYVIFIGPGLYLILRFIKKRDWYWIMVPVTTLITVFLVYWAGRGFEVDSTNVYSVTVENLADTQNAITYLHCLDAGHKEWELRLAKEYDYVGSAIKKDYTTAEGNYFYHVQKKGDRLYFGINPTTGFEDAYLQAGVAKKPESGSLIINNDKTISNFTEHTFPYFAIVDPDGDRLKIYENLSAGETIALSELKEDYSGKLIGRRGDIMSDYIYNYLDDKLHGQDAENGNIITALGLGITSVYAQGNLKKDTVVIGVTPDWDKVVDDKCNEVSYRCLYAVMGDKYAIH